MYVQGGVDESTRVLPEPGVRRADLEDHDTFWLIDESYTHKFLIVQFMLLILFVG